MTPGEDVEGVEQEEDADENDPDGAAKGAEEAELVGGVPSSARPFPVAVILWTKSQTPRPMRKKGMSR